MAITPAQIDAATAVQDAAAQDAAAQVQLVAGPGTGKSQAIEARVCWLIASGVDPEEIAVVSFTRASAADLRVRVHNHATEPGYTTNKWVWRQEIIPQPDLLVTKLVVNSTWISQPPTLKTNEVVTTEWRSIPVPGESALNVIEADGNTLTLAGQTKPTLPTGLYGNLTALWPQPGVVVWTEATSGDYGWPVYSRGWGWGGLNFHPKSRRNSTDLDDWIFSGYGPYRRWNNNLTPAPKDDA